MATKVNFSNMLKEVVEQPSSSRVKRFIKMKSLGVSTKDARNILDKRDAAENESEEPDIFLETPKYKSAPEKSPIKKLKKKKVKGI